MSLESNRCDYGGEDECPSEPVLLCLSVDKDWWMAICRKHSKQCKQKNHTTLPLTATPKEQREKMKRDPGQASFEANAKAQLDGPIASKTTKVRPGRRQSKIGAEVDASERKAAKNFRRALKRMGRSFKESQRRLATATAFEAAQADIVAAAMSFAAARERFLARGGEFDFDFEDNLLEKCKVLRRLLRAVGSRRYTAADMATKLKPGGPKTSGANPIGKRKARTPSTTSKTRRSENSAGRRCRRLGLPS